MRYWKYFASDQDHVTEINQQKDNLTVTFSNKGINSKPKTPTGGRKPTKGKGCDVIAIYLVALFLRLKQIDLKLIFVSLISGEFH